MNKLFITNILLQYVVHAFECLDRKTTNRNFFSQYIYPNGGREAFETTMATKCFYELMSASRKIKF